MHKNHFSLTDENNVWIARQISAVEPVSVTSPMQKPADLHFWTGVPPSDLSHAFASLSGRQRIHGAVKIFELNKNQLFACRLREWMRTIASMSEFCEIGAELLESSRTDFKARGVLTPLFPYIYEAAQNMSARAISRWLLSTHQVKISDVTISKALRNPEKHWEAFADYVEPWARTVENSVDPEMECFLSDVAVFNHFASRPDIRASDKQEASDARDEFEGAVHWLRKNWFSLAPSTRANCERYFHVPSEAGDADEK